MLGRVDYAVTQQPRNQLGTRRRESGAPIRSARFYSRARRRRRSGFDAEANRLTPAAFVCRLIIWSALGSQDRRTSAVDQQRSQVSIAALADAQQHIFAAARMLWGYQAEPGRELPPIPADPAVYHFHPVGLVGNFVATLLTIEEARVRAFLRMIRVGEGTEGAAGYARLFGGESFVNNYGRDFRDHPRILITRTNSKGKTLKSTAAGAYQVMGYTWDDPANIQYRTKYGIDDFSPANQDRFCVVLLKFKRHAIGDIKLGNLERAIFDDQCNSEWASLPGDVYQQGGVSMDKVKEKFSQYLNDELSGKSDLAVSVDALDDLIK